MANFCCHRPFQLLVIACVIIFSLRHTRGATIAQNYQLVEDLLKNYNTQVRPSAEDSNVTQVYLEFELLSILDVNEQDQTIKTSAQLNLEWQDDVLRWSSTDYGGVEEVLLKQKSVWVPDIVPANTVSTHTELGYDNLRVRVSNKGVVLWEPSVLLTTSCSIDITYYPLDTQICTIAFHTSVSVQSEVHVYLDKTDPIVMTHFSENGLWNLLNYSTADFGESVNRRTVIAFQLQLQRRREFYILNIVLPILFLSVTSSLTFALPADAGEKMGLSITILLAYAVYLTLVTEAMPSTSLQVSYLAIYLIILLAMTALSVVLSVWILSYHHRSEKRPVHGWLAKVTLTLGKALRMPKDDSEAPYDVDSPDLGHLKMKKNSIGPCDVLADAPSILNAIEMKPQGRSHGNEETKLPTVQRKPVEVSGRLVAQTFDRLIFILFFTISLGSTAILMLILWFGSIQQEENTRM